MLTTRQNVVKESLRFYNDNYNFSEPYKVLLDVSFVITAFKNRIKIVEKIPKFLQNKVELFTTPCVIHQIKQPEQKEYTAEIEEIANKVSLHRCKHRKPIAKNCILSVVGKDNYLRYIVATQDTSLQNIIKQTPEIPLLYIKNRTLNFHIPKKNQYTDINENHSTEIKRNVSKKINKNTIKLKVNTTKQHLSLDDKKDFINICEIPCKVKKIDCAKVKCSSVEAENISMTIKQNVQQKIKKKMLHPALIAKKKCIDKRPKKNFYISLYMKHELVKHNNL